MKKLAILLGILAYTIGPIGTAFASAESMGIPTKVLSYEDGTIVVWLDRIIPCGDISAHSGRAVTYPSNRGSAQGRAQMLSLITAAILSNRQILFDTDAWNATLGACTGYGAMMVDAPPG